MSPLGILIGLAWGFSAAAGVAVAFAACATKYEDDRRTTRIVRTILAIIALAFFANAAAWAFLWGSLL